MKMSLLGYVLLLTAALCCTAAPAAPDDHCEKPEQIKGAQLQGEWHDETYPPGKVANFVCLPEYTQDGPIKMACIEGIWWHIAKGQCKGKKCDRPDIKHGIIDRDYYYPREVGRYLEYYCESYQPRRWTRIYCTNAGWEPEPKCSRQCISRDASFENAQLIGLKSVYMEGDKVQFRCKYNYQTPDGKDYGERTCLPNGKFTPAKCSGTGVQCGPPPAVQYGDTVEIRKVVYRSGEKVEFRCPQYYILDGNRFVTCLNGVWNEAPVCIEPCTAKERDMESNNIQLKWRPDRKLYTRHGEPTEFICKPGYEALPDTQMRITCNQGNLEYPKCFKIGFCVLQQSTMIANNIHYNLSTVVDHGQKILFQCNEGMMAENNLEAKCEQKNINYPRCTAAKSCKAPEILNGFVKTEQASYDSGSYVEFDCDEGYVINLAMKVKCENGLWSKLPVCYSPCKISPEDLTKHNIQLLSSNDQKTIPDKNYKHGTEISVVCMSGFRRSTNAALVLECYDGKFKYPRCFSGRTCRILQDNLDENNLELDEVHENEVFYAEGEVIHYKCKNGFNYRGQPTGKCSEQKMSYPKCTEESSV